MTLPLVIPKNATIPNLIVPPLPIKPNEIKVRQQQNLQIKLKIPPLNEKVIPPQNKKSRLPPKNNVPPTP